MKPGFMSSVCPHQTLPELIATAQRYGYEGIEFRVEWNHHHGIELTAAPKALAQARRMLAENGLVASCLATGVHFNSSDPAEHGLQQEDLQRYIALAAEVGAPYLRTFADALPENDPAARDAVIDLAARSYAAVDDVAREHDVIVLVETHTNMLAQWAKQIIDTADAQNLQVLWHTGHHLQRDQSVDEAYTYLRGHVRHVHFTAEEDNPHVTDADNQRTFDLLAEDGFDGFFSVEIINPDDPEAVLAHHSTKFREFMQAVHGG